MDAIEKALFDAIERDPSDEDAKQCYQQFLAETRPDSVELQLLRCERELAEAHADQSEFDRLVDDYIEFRTEHSYYFWDHRGFLDYFFRSFKVWLVSFNESRRFAVDQALQLTVGISIDLDNLPAVVVTSTRTDSARDAKEKIIDFVKRYKGPTGREPEVQPDEIKLAVTPSWIDSL